MTARTWLQWRDGAAGPVLRLLARERFGWQELGLCTEADPEAFFPERGGDVRPAKRICRQCPVIRQCLEYALENDERWGVWGGLSEMERRRLRRERRAA